MSMTPAPGSPPASLFPALGPVGSAITSLVLMGATAVATAIATYLAGKGFISADDTPKVVAGIVAALLGLATWVYKMVSNRMAAKVTAVAALRGVTVVAPLAIAASPAHAADTSVITPSQAAQKFGTKQ